MKVILLQDIYKTGVAGEIVDVADGYARNYLIPTKRAKLASETAVEEHKDLMQEVELRRASYNKLLNDLARQIDGVELLFERRASSTGTLYGSVTTQEIADALFEKTNGNVDINRRRISQQSIRELGEFQVPVRLGNEISPILNVVVVREGELEEFLAEREARERGEIPEDNEGETIDNPEDNVEVMEGFDDNATDVLDPDDLTEALAQDTAEAEDE